MPPKTQKKKTKKTPIDLLRVWCEEPHRLAHLVGFDKITPAHDEWILGFLSSQKKYVLQAHRNSYKTTCGLVALLLLFMLKPNARVLIVRKSLEMAQKLLASMQKLLQADIVRAWFYSVHKVTTLEKNQWTKSLMTLTIKTSITAEPSLTAAGTGNARTGDHYDFIWCDDIVNADDRYSRAERERVKSYVHELENVIEPKGFMRYTGTPWHPEDAFSILPPATKYPLGSIVIADIDAAWIDKIKSSMPRALFAANYELQHVKDVAPEFAEPIFAEPPANLKRFWFIDPAFGGRDCTAIAEGGEQHGVFYVADLILFRVSVADKYDEIEKMFWARNITRIFYEATGAQKLLGPELQRRNLPCEGVANNKNKYARIVATLKPAWQNLRFSEALKTRQNIAEQDAAPHPLTQVLEFGIDAEHDDAPDALAGLIDRLKKPEATAHEVSWL